MVTDVAGFAAAVYHRGVAVVHVSTTLLGQIDAAIGGKTGVNLPEGKNLVGAFWQPRAVLCDTDLLATLPPARAAQRHGRAGQVPLPRRRQPRSGPLDELPFDEQVARCVRIKAAVVAGDEREGGRRAILNYGHTLGHALEIAGGLRPAPRRGGRHRPRLRRRAGARARPHRRRRGWPSTAGSSAGYDLPVDAAGRARPRRARRALRPGQEGHRRRHLRARRPATASRPSPASTASAIDAAFAAMRRADQERPVTEPVVLLLSGPNLNLLGEREPAVYGTATLDDHVATAPRRRPSTATTVEHLQSNHEGELVDAIHARPGPVRGHRDQRRRLHPLRLGHPRRAGRVRRPGRRAAPVQPERPRAVAAHVGDRPGGHRHHLRVRRRRLPARRRRRHREPPWHDPPPLAPSPELVADRTGWPGRLPVRWRCRRWTWPTGCRASGRRSRRRAATRCSSPSWSTSAT